MPRTRETGGSDRGAECAGSWGAQALIRTCSEPAGYVDGVNVYQFVGGRPTRSVDPTGLNELPVDTIPDPDHPAVNVTVGQPDFFRMYVSGQSWGRSQPVDNVAGGEIFAILDANAHWIKTYADAQYCRWDYFGHVETFVHKLVVPPSLQNKRNLQADVASFNAMAAEHENEVIANIQSIWSPAVLINRTDGDGQDILDREYARRTREFSEKWSPDSQDEFRFVIAAKLLIQKIMQDAGLVGQLNLQYWENIANSHD